jgi:hypothetical protein
VNFIHRFDHEGDGTTDLWWSQVCSLSGWERDIFDKIVSNHQFRTVAYKGLPRAVRIALSHYMDDPGKLSCPEEEKAPLMVAN